MENKFTLTASNGMPNSVSITIPHIPKPIVRKAYDYAISAFRDVQIVNEDTGEITHIFYEDDEWYMAERSIGDVIDLLNNLYVNHCRG
jgi:hypothetical protein